MAIHSTCSIISPTYTPLLGARAETTAYSRATLTQLSNLCKPLGEGQPRGLVGQPLCCPLTDRFRLVRTRERHERISCTTAAQQFVLSCRVIRCVVSMLKRDHVLSESILWSRRSWLTHRRLALFPPRATEQILTPKFTQVGARIGYCAPCRQMYVLSVNYLWFSLSAVVCGVLDRLAVLPTAP